MDEALSVSAEPDRDAILWWPLWLAIAGEQTDRADAARRRRRTAEVTGAVAAGRRYADVLERSTKASIEADGPSLAGRRRAQRRRGGSQVARGPIGPAAWASALEARRALKQAWELAYAQYRHAEAILESGSSIADAAILLRDACTRWRSTSAQLHSWIAIEALAVARPDPVRSRRGRRSGRDVNRY